MRRFKVIVTIVEEGTDDLGLCAMSSWKPALEVHESGVEALKSLLWAIPTEEVKP